MEKIKNNMIYALKNIRYHIKDFLVFFIAIFVIQSVFGIISFCYHNNNILDYEYASAEYSYHLMLENLNYDQYDYFINNKKYSNLSGDALYTVSGVKERGKGSVSGARYDVQITFIKNPAKSYKTFVQRYFEGLEENGDGNYKITHTSLLDYEQSVKGNRRVQFLTMLAVFLCSLLLMLRLFTVRMNHYRFTYGIYMTFGANFKKLFASSNYEMLIITLIMYIPSVILSFALSKLIYTLAHVPFRMTVMPFVYMFVFSVIISFLAVYMPMKKLSFSAPVDALSAEDNSNLIVSPRISSDRIAKRFPDGYILHTLVRFRKYIATVIFFGVAFSSVFVGGAYFSEIYSAASEYNYPRYTLDYSGGDDSFSEADRDVLMAVDGVIGIEKYRAQTALTANSHVLFTGGQVKLFSGFLSRKVNGKKYKVTNSVEYRCMDDVIAKELEAFEHSGDVFSALQSDNTVVVSDTLYNEKMLKISVGDKIIIGSYLYAKTQPETYETGNDYLNQQLDCNEYAYREYTVGAVIHGMSTGDNIRIYLPGVDYALICSESYKFNSADIYTSPDISVTDAENARESIKNYVSGYDGVTVKNNIHSEQLHIKEKNTPTMLYIIALLILLISPTVWIFSQILFYFKREDEIYILEAFGASRAEVRRVYYGEGLLAALISSAAYTALSFVISLLVCKVANRLFVYPGFAFRIPIIPFVTGLCVTVASAVISCVIPYLVYNKKKNTLVSVLSEDSE